MGFEPTVPATERPQNHALNRAATEIGETLFLLLLNKRYNSCRVLVFSTIFFHSRRSWTFSDHFRSFIFRRSFLTSSFHLCLGLPTGRVTYGCHLCIFLTMLVSGSVYYYYYYYYLQNVWTRQRTAFLCFVDRASLYNLVNKANLVHNFS